MELRKVAPPRGGSLTLLLSLSVNSRSSMNQLYFLLFSIALFCVASLHSSIVYNFVSSFLGLSIPFFTMQNPAQLWRFLALSTNICLSVSACLLISKQIITAADQAGDLRIKTIIKLLLLLFVLLTLAALTPLLFSFLGWRLAWPVGAIAGAIAILLLAMIVFPKRPDSKSRRGLSIAAVLLFLGQLAVPISEHWLLPVFELGGGLEGLQQFAKFESPTNFSAWLYRKQPNQLRLEVAETSLRYLYPLTDVHFLEERSTESTLTFAVRTRILTDERTYGQVTDHKVVQDLGMTPKLRKIIVVSEPDPDPARAKQDAFGLAQIEKKITFSVPIIIALSDAIEKGVTLRLKFSDGSTCSFLPYCLGIALTSSDEVVSGLKLSNENLCEPARFSVRDLTSAEQIPQKFTPTSEQQKKFDESFESNLNIVFCKRKF